MPQHIELNPVSHLTIGTIGPPGQRVFYLQGSKGRDIVSLIIEKQQAAILASSLESLLDELTKQQQLEDSPPDEKAARDLRLREPVESLFRVGNLGLGFSEETSLVVLVAYELVDEDEEPSMVSFWASPEQIKLLIPHIQSIVKSGRPLCGNCGEPIDAEGHFCPRRNGHLH
ncbi:MAG: DUF3090 domain-containing protein [Ardenticatenaceae bacterium]|nr:DUF3090 domain-containing protein [Ardenticatenaceae bacterium]